MGVKEIFGKLFPQYHQKQNKDYSLGSLSLSTSGITYVVNERTMIRIPELYAAIDMLANDIAETDWSETTINYGANKLRSNVEVENSKWNVLLNKKPNEYQSKSEFWKASIMDFFLRDGFYWYLARDTKGRVVEIYPIDPANISLVKDKEDPTKFYYELTTYEGPTPDKTKIDYKDIISVTYSDISRVADAEFKTINNSLLQQLGLKNSFDLDTLNGSSRVQGIVKVPNDIEKDQEQKIMDRFKNFFTGNSGNRSGVLVIDPKYDFQLIEKDKVQIKGAVDKDFAEQVMIKLANALHIPLPKLNMGAGTGVYKGREGVEIDYLMNAIKPILNKIRDKLNHVIFGDVANKEFIFDFSKQLTFDAATRGTLSNQLRIAGVLTTNELRAMNGYGPIDNGDEIYIASNTMKLGSNPVDQGNNTPPAGGKTP